MRSSSTGSGSVTLQDENATAYHNNIAIQVVKFHQLNRASTDPLFPEPITTKNANDIA